MKISNFDKRLLIEQIRYIESKQTLACDTEEVHRDVSVHSDFEERLWQRARRLVDYHDLSLALGRATRLLLYVKIIALIVAALLGALGIIYAISDSHTINIYWLLLVLLGFNFLSMLLWLAGVSLNVKGLTAGVLARLISWLTRHFQRKRQISKITSNHASTQTSSQAGNQADRAWLACNFSGDVGKWQLSKITHQLWLAYLLTGLVFLLLLLMLRQYDFVWGTTLLSDTAFVKLTEILSTPLQVLGFATPTADQVQDTRTGVVETLTDVHRYRWAQFLLGALLIYGILPRILLWSWSALMCVYARRRFVLDFYLPYYVSLRQQLMPLASHGLVIDADISPPAISETAASPASGISSKTPVPHTLPEETCWVAVELGDSISWPVASIDNANVLGHVVDRKSLRSIVQHLQANTCPLIAVAVSSARPPDRGVQRTITSLMTNSKQRWLVLLQSQVQLNNMEQAVSGNRLAAWYRLAEACEVPVDHVISMRLV